MHPILSYNLLLPDIKFADNLSSYPRPLIIRGRKLLYVGIYTGHHQSLILIQSNIKLRYTHFDMLVLATLPLKNITIHTQTFQSVNALNACLRLEASRSPNVTCWLLSSNRSTASSRSSEDKRLQVSGEAGK